LTGRDENWDAVVREDFITALPALIHHQRLERSTVWRLARHNVRPVSRVNGAAARNASAAI